MPSLETSPFGVTDGRPHEGVVSLAQKLNLVVPASVGECRRKKESLTSQARNKTISSALIILQATIGREKPCQSESVCTEDRGTGARVKRSSATHLSGCL